MPEDTSQQRDQDVVAYQTFAGLRNDVDPERFTQADLAVASNCDLDKSGRLARRAGYTNEVAGASHSLWATDELGLALFVAGTQLKRLNTDYTTSVLRSGLTPELPTSYTRVNERVYFSNGNETGVVENGVARSWGLPVPALPGIVTTVGNMPAGDYQYVMTYFRADGQESGAGLAGIITLPAGSGLLFLMPVSNDPNVSSKGIYLTTPNGEILYLALVAPNSTTTAIYQNDTSTLAVPLQTQFMGPPPAGHLTGFYHGHMFVGVGDTWYPSEPYNYELFDPRKYISLDGRLTLFAALEDKEVYEKGKKSGLFVGTDRSCGILAGSSADDFQYVPKTDYGAVEGALDYVDGSLFGDNSMGAKQLPMWLTTQGLCVGLPDLEVRNLTRTKYGFTAAGRGAALFMPGPNRFIAVSNY